MLSFGLSEKTNQMVSLNVIAFNITKTAQYQIKTGNPLFQIELKKIKSENNITNNYSITENEIEKVMMIF